MNFQNFQPVKVNNENNPDHGRAGTVRGQPETVGTGKNARQSVPVQLDGDDAPRLQPADDLTPL